MSDKMSDEMSHENNGRKWTKEDEDQLQDCWGFLSIPQIAKKLKRTEESIRGRKNLLGLGRHLHSGQTISLNQLYLEIYGRRPSSVTTQMLIRKKIPVRIKITREKQFRMIDIDEFWKWLEKNPSAMTLSGMEKGSLGAEPDWVQEKRRMDAEKKLINNNGRRRWSRQEDDILRIYVRQQKYSYTEISEKINRTESAIIARLLFLNEKGRPVRQKSKKWTEPEKATVKEMMEKGYGMEKIAKTVGKTAMAVRGIAIRTGSTEAAGRKKVN